MDRADAAAWFSARYGAYLSAVNRPSSDVAGGLKEAIDDTLRVLRYAEADIIGPEIAEGDDSDDVKFQLAYRGMAQIVRDMGPAFFNVGLGQRSFSLAKVRDSAEKDLNEARDVVLERFGTLDVVTDETSSAVATLRLAFLTRPATEMLG